jgi:plastocyanin
MLAARLAGAALLVATAGIHLDLYATGYNLIPTIGVLFVLQAVAGFILGAAVLVTRRGPGALTALLGAGYAISTLAGYLMALWIGTFGFQEVYTTAGLVAGLVEVAAFGILLHIAAAGMPKSGPLARLLEPVEKLKAALPGGHPAAVGAISVVAVIVLGISLATASTPSTGTSVSDKAAANVPVGLHMTMKDYKFFPANPVVTPGEKVELTNLDIAPHTVTGGIPPNTSGLFGTPLLQLNQTGFFIAPKKPGRYPFFCIVHHFMVGMLIVK